MKVSQHAHNAPTPSGHALGILPASTSYSGIRPKPYGERRKESDKSNPNQPAQSTTHYHSRIHTRSQRSRPSISHAHHHHQHQFLPKNPPLHITPLQVQEKDLLMLLSNAPIPIQRLSLACSMTSQNNKRSAPSFSTSSCYHGIQTVYEDTLSTFFHSTPMQLPIRQSLWQPQQSHSLCLPSPRLELPIDN